VSLSVGEEEEEEEEKEEEEEEEECTKHKQECHIKCTGNERHELV